MVALKLLVVDVDSILEDDSAKLRSIKRDYPTIAQLFLARKTHCVHIVGPPVSTASLVIAANRIYHTYGEPFALSSPERIAMVTTLTNVPEGPEAFALAVKHIFAEDEGFVYDMKERVKWAIAGPIFGIRAATQERRYELMQHCYGVFTQIYGIRLLLRRPSCSLVTIPGPTQMTVELTRINYNKDDEVSWCTLNDIEPTIRLPLTDQRRPNPDEDEFSSLNTEIDRFVGICRAPSVIDEFNMSERAVIKRFLIKVLAEL